MYGLDCVVGSFHATKMNLVGFGGSYQLAQYPANLDFKCPSGAVPRDLTTKSDMVQVQYILMAPNSSTLSNDVGASIIIVGVVGSKEMTLCDKTI